jgi:hypothetical protein
MTDEEEFSARSSSNGRGKVTHVALSVARVFFRTGFPPRCASPYSSFCVATGGYCFVHIPLTRPKPFPYCC